MGLKVNDSVRAIEGSVSSIWAKGRIGVIEELRDPVGYSGNDSNNLVRWGDDSILLGFNPLDVEVITQK